LGDPVEIKVRGYNLTLRKSEAAQILVQTES
jgi:Fe2+ transport system protein FeoA